MPFDLQKYRESLKTKYNIADEDLAAMMPKGDIDQNMMMLSDYSRQVAVAKQQQQHYQAKYAELTEYEQSLQEMEGKFGPREGWSAALQAHMGRQNPDGSGTVTQSGLSKDEVQSMLKTALEAQAKQFQSELEQVGQGSAAFAEFLVEARDHWKDAYGGPFPKDDFKKFYVDNGYTNPRHAMQSFELPFKEKKREAEWEQKLEEARKEGEVRARSTMTTPDGFSSGGTWASGDGTSIGAAATNPASTTTGGAENKEAAFIAGFRNRIAEAAK